MNEERFLDELFAEWAIAGGVDGITRRQVAVQDKSRRGHAQRTDGAP